MAKKKKAAVNNLTELIEHVEHAQDLQKKLNCDEEVLITIAGNKEGFGVVVDGDPGLIDEGIAAALDTLAANAQISFEDLMKEISEAHEVYLESVKNNEAAADQYFSPEDVFEKDKTDFS